MRCFMRKILLLCIAISLYAGPPMLTNDPFLPEKDIEINVAVQTEKMDKETDFTPIIDFNYVAAKNLELTLYTTYKVMDTEESEINDFSLSELAFKYMFFNDNSFTASFVGGYRFTPINNSFEKEDELEVQLPINYEINEKTNLVFTTTYIYNNESSDKSHLEFGSYVDYSLNKNNFFVEGYAEQNNITDEFDYLMNFGHIYEITSKYSTLLSFGKTLKTDSSEEDALFAYVGLQIRLEM